MKKKLIIQHLKNLFHRLKIHPLTVLYFGFALIGGYLKWYLSALMIVCLHELCHLLMAYYFHFEIEKVEILPFGAYLSLHDFYFHSLMEEMCVVLAGPCSHLIIYSMICLCSQGVYRDYLLLMNMCVFGFNLLPIYPMDGYRLINLLLQSLIDLKKAFYFSLKLSVFSFCIFFVFYLRINTIVILGYLFVQQFYLLKFIPEYLRRYYSEIATLKPAKKVKLHHHLSYRRGYHNYYLLEHGIKDEKEMVFIFLKNVKK